MPSVDAPVGDFFAVGHGFERRGQVRDGPQQLRRPGAQQLLADALREVLQDHADQRGPPARSTTSTTTWTGRRCPSLPPDTPYFHARYKQELPAPAEKKVYTFLDVKGRGFYVGTVLSVVQPEAGWFGEGDERFYVDGEKEPSIIGTGSEDYFNDAWGLHVVDGPVHRRHRGGRHGARARA